VSWGVQLTLCIIHRLVIKVEQSVRCVCVCVCPDWLIELRFYIKVFDLQLDDFSELSSNTHTRGHRYKLIKNHNNVRARSSFFVTVLLASGITCHLLPLISVQPRVSSVISNLLILLRSWNRFSTMFILLSVCICVYVFVYSFILHFLFALFLFIWNCTLMQLCSVNCHCVHACISFY